MIDWDAFLVDIKPPTKTSGGMPNELPSPLAGEDFSKEGEAETTSLEGNADSTDSPPTPLLPLLQPATRRLPAVECLKGMRACDSDMKRGGHSQIRSYSRRSPRRRLPPGSSGQEVKVKNCVNVKVTAPTPRGADAGTDRGTCLSPRCLMAAGALVGTVWTMMLVMLMSLPDPWRLGLPYPDFLPSQSPPNMNGGTSNNSTFSAEDRESATAVSTAVDVLQWLQLLKTFGGWIANLPKVR